MTPARRILVVEDEYHIAMDLKQGLEDAGLTVIGPVRSVADASSALENEDAVDAAVLDINLGGEKIFPVCDALESREVFYVFATGYNAEDVPEAYRHITRFEKPVNMARLIAVLQGGSGS